MSRTIRELMAFLKYAAANAIGKSHHGIDSDILREISGVLHGVRCVACDGEGWIPPIDGHTDGSQVPSRRCQHCDGVGIEPQPLHPAPAPAAVVPGKG